MGQRLFAAVLPSRAAMAEVARAADALLAVPGAQRLRWRDRAGWHVTLAFYGDLAADQVLALTGRLAEVARESEPFGLRLAGGGTFGDSTLWVGLGGQTVALARLAAAVGPGVEEHDEYRPHLTLARAPRPPVPLAPFAAPLSGFSGARWPVERIVLMRSENGRYTEHGAWKLGVR
ncbi:RNA 2',3'-cyclic phosphodiesterase [Streptomyces sp. PT12]|uniref:RNA 2',3'-cyclic phosphodiesterase n=1 Tax=Streptomyces sp. PT12 TaxID=1510197 RepID=UPI000DE4CBE6|nr:RNA 2',3'-cyclic phosphodiesterase [Streptomyces sp. PT12]RBM17768.1 RNA 2',3'-cyclic phosphodiesterase [Streptomyces sp. PT12]